MYDRAAFTNRSSPVARQAAASGRRWKKRFNWAGHSWWRMCPPLQSMSFRPTSTGVRL